MKKILLLGALGYIGSRLDQVLTDAGYDVKGQDICWFHTSDTIWSKHDYDQLTREDLEQFDVVIVLAGHSSVPSCNGDLYSPWLNNVTNFVNLLDKLDDQLVIYASSASVYGNSEPGETHKETNKTFVPVNNYDVTKYALDQQALLANHNGKNIIGLRFGTVNGWSPLLRADVMINSMHNSTKEDGGQIQVTNKQISRAILGIEDLCKAMIRCIEQPKPGIYNLASFNSTVGEIAWAVSTEIGCEIKDNGKTMQAYDFAIDTTLFEQTYDFTFNETPATIVKSLCEKEEPIVQHRNHYLIYNWENQNGFRKDQ